MAKHPGGAPRKPFDWNLVESLAIAEATEEFIAERLLIANGEEVNSRTITAKIKLLQRRIKERFECSYVQYREKRIEPKRIKLRGWQWKSAENGNITMQIFLGKQYLGQSDKIQSEISGRDGGPIRHANSFVELIEQLEAEEK